MTTVSTRERGYRVAGPVSVSGVDNVMGLPGPPVLQFGDVGQNRLVEGPWRSAAVWHVNGTSRMIARSACASHRHVLLLCRPLTEVLGNLQRSVVQSSSRPNRLAPYMPGFKLGKPQNLGQCPDSYRSELLNLQEWCLLDCDFRHV
jgi:hypothetical protein